MTFLDEQSANAHSWRKADVRGMNGYGITGLWRRVLKKSFLAGERIFFGPLMRFAHGDVRDHIVSEKSDHGPSYRRY
jgi:hypothetical protein